MSATTATKASLALALALALCGLGFVTAIHINSQTIDTLLVNRGGTGQTSYTDGQLLIGNSSSNTLTKASLTAGSNITITPGHGSISIAAASAGTTCDATHLCQQDEFCGGINTSGSIGQLGWRFNGGGGSSTEISGTTVTDVDHPCVWQVSSGAGANTWEWLILGNAGTFGKFPNPFSKAISSTFVVKHNGTFAGSNDFTVRVGWTQNSGLQNTADGVYFEAAVTSGSGTWHCINRASSVQTDTSTAIAYDSSWHNLTIASDGTSAIFSIDGTQKCSQSANIPTGVLEPGIEVTNVAINTNTRNFYVDYFQLTEPVTR